MQLTPWMLASMTLFVMLVVPVLTLAISAWLLGWYRRAVTRQMQQAGRSSGDPWPASSATADSATSTYVADAITGSAPDPLQGPRHLLLRYTAAGAAFAVVFAAAAYRVYPHELGVPGFLRQTCDRLANEVSGRYRNNSLYGLELDARDAADGGGDDVS